MSHQPGRFAAAQAAQRDQVVGGIQPVAADRVEEPDGLRRGPHRDRRPDPGALPLGDPRRRPHHRAGTARRWHLRAGRGVDADQPGPDRRVQRGAQRRPHPGQGRGGDRVPCGLVLAGDRGEHGLHVLDGQIGQQDAPQARLEVQADMRGVPADRRRPRPGSLLQPPVEPLARRHQRLRVGGHPQPCQRLFGRTAGGEATTPDATALSVRPRGQFQRQVPAAVPALPAPRAPAPQPTAGRRVAAPAPAVDTSLGAHDQPLLRPQSPLS
jgi:hypothetical protein